MKTNEELSLLVGHNVVDSTVETNGRAYNLLIKGSMGYYTAHYIDGQKMGIILKGTISSRGKKPYLRVPADWKK